jgi:hypothetical protein
MTVELGQDLEQFLHQDPHYEVFTTRDTSSWSPVFAAYFDTNWSGILDWEKEAKRESSSVADVGQPGSISPVQHNSAAPDVASRLYGITKWADENNIDIEIHIHFNDETEHRAGMPGQYSGFAIYVPAAQYDNSTTTKAVADTVFKRLAKYNPVSNLVGESAGIVDDPELIAIGSYNTANAASMLIEYAYVYEPQLQNADTRHLEIKDLAYQTYLGLEDFFDPSNVKIASRSYDTLMLPYQWPESVTPSDLSKADGFALQSALVMDGDYPPEGVSLNDCPRTGTIGNCTKAALAAFQEKYGLADSDGEIGTSTLEWLNRLYGIGAL